jgi:hypothetical protein
MLADLPFSEDFDDQLGFAPFADAIAGVIDSPHTATPFVMAINGKWGSGKTTLGMMIQRRLRAKPAAEGNSPHVTCWFSAWMHDDAPNLATSLAAEVARTANSSRSLWRRLASPVHRSLSAGRSRSLRKLIPYCVAAIFLLALVTFLYSKSGTVPPSISKIAPWVVTPLTQIIGYAFATALIAAVLLVFQFARFILPVAKAVGDFVRDPEAAAKTASMQEVRQQLGKLIQEGTPKKSRFVIFIDDLDRCRPPRSVDVLEVVNQLLDHPRVVVVILADMQVVAECAAIKYRSLAKGRGGRERDRSSINLPSYSWDYLQKVVQLQFDLPAYPTDALRQMVTTLAKQVPSDVKMSFLARLSSKLWDIASRTASRLSDLGFSFLVVTLCFVYLLLYICLGRGWLHWRLGAVIVSQHQVEIVLGVLVGVLLRIGWARISLARTRRMLDRQIKSRIAAGERDFSRVEAAVKWQNRNLQKNAETRGLLRERLQRYLEDESELQREAEDEVMRHLEPVPRHAKRLLNRLRLLLFVAHERRIFGGTPPLTPRHIGKWAVLCERWPELAQSVLRQPGIMQGLENAASHAVVLGGACPVYKDDSALERFCISDNQTLLAEVIDRIAEFRRAVPIGRANQVVFRGIVRTIHGEPVPGFTLRLGTVTVRSDSRGAFRVRGDRNRPLPVPIFAPDPAREGDWDVVESPTHATPGTPIIVTVKSKPRRPSRFN